MEVTSRSAIKNHMKKHIQNNVNLNLSSKSKSDHFARQPTACSDPMIQDIILPQIGLAQEMDAQCVPMGWPVHCYSVPMLCTNAVY